MDAFAAESAIIKGLREVNQKQLINFYVYILVVVTAEELVAAYVTVAEALVVVSDFEDDESSEYHP